MNIDDVLKRAFYGQVTDYKNMLLQYYPAHGETGFTERNQTCYFVSNLLRLLQQETNQSKDNLSPFVWYEAPIPNGNIDAVVFSRDQKAVFFIEAKRLSVTRKKRELIDDARRLFDKSNRDYITKKYTERNGELQHQYIICLADVWFETPWKRSIPCWWAGITTNIPELGNFKPSHDNERFYEITSRELRLSVPWSLNNQYVHSLHEVKIGNYCLGNYCLLMGFMKIDAT